MARTTGALMMLALATSMLVPARSWAVDQPIDGLTLQLKRTPSGARLMFVSKDPDFLFPPIGSADDPAAIAGALIEVFSGTEGLGSLTVPSGSGRQGWTVKDGSTSDAYKFTNTLAPSGVTGVRSVVMKQGRLLKIVSRVVPIPLQMAQGHVGIRVTIGSRRSCALFRPNTVVKDESGVFRAKNTGAAGLLDCSDAALTTAGGCGGSATFQVIQQRIFSAHGCNVSSCHGPFVAANLDLRPGASYAELINVTADNATAAGAGKRLVVPGNAAASFLSQKLRGTLAAGEGSRMPLIGGVIPDVELDLIDAWIAAGAPETGEVSTAPCLPPQTYEPAPALTPPSGGYQLVLTGPTLSPGQEQEGCLWMRAPNPTTFDVGKWEFSLNPGTHHFAVFEWNRAGEPVTGVWTANDFGCFSGTQFGNNISGSPQAPYYVDAYPSGVARRLVAGHFLGLNAHYFNAFNVPIQIKVYINIYPYSGPTPRLATTIVDIDDTYGINIPPFTQQIYPPSAGPRARWTNTATVPRNVIYLGGHMHNRGLRFTVWDPSGTKLYESFDWAHPNQRLFSPPLVVAPGGFVDYECLYDNGVTRPVRTDGGGNPVNLLFGVSAEDAMCIVTGAYYE